MVWVKRIFPLSLLLAVLAALLVGSFAENRAVLSIINQSFLIGLIAMVAGSCFYVLRSGFFHVFSMGFAKLKALVFRKPKVLESDFFQLKKGFPTAQLTVLLIASGCCVLLFSVSLTLFYYFI